MDSAKTCKELSDVFGKIDSNLDDMNERVLQSLQGTSSPLLLRLAVFDKP
jgi:hypothetical protein